MSNDTFQWSGRWRLTKLRLERANALKCAAMQRRKIVDGVNTRVSHEFWEQVAADCLSQIRKIEMGNIEWTDIPGMLSYYKASECGKIFSMFQNRVIKGSFDKEGYRQITVFINGVAAKRKIHRLIALTFIPNPNNKPQVNHLDFDKSNNCVDNLVWATSKEDAEHKVANERQAKGPRKNITARTLFQDYLNHQRDKK